MIKSLLNISITAKQEAIESETGNQRLVLFETRIFLF
jgi:hypothetical protein